MALSRPFAYNNTGSPISGTTQYGDLVVGNIVADYAADYGGVVWWGGPDEDLRYIIGNARPGGQPVPSGVTETANVGFWGTPLGDKTDGAFLNLANYVGAKNGQPPFTNTNDAVTWLNDNGFYTSYNTVNVILEGFYFEGSVGAGYQATVTKPLNNDIIINFTDVLGTITGTPLLINSSVEILSGQTTGYTQTFTDYDYNNLTQENSFSGLTFNMTGSSQYYLVSEISGSTFNVTPTPTPTNSETPTNTPIPTNTPTNTTTPTPSVTPGLTLNGLVLDLDAGNSASYAGTGTTWTDLSGKGNHGTLVNSVTYNSANQGYLVFNGNGSFVGSGGYNPYVSLPRSTDFDFNTGDFTVENWIYMTPTNEHPIYISLNVNGSNYAAFRMEYYNGNLYLSHSYDGNSHVSAGNFAFTRNAWQHIVVSRIAGSAVVYVNGVPKLTYSLPGSLIAQQNSQIGDLRGSNGYYNFSGNIATTKIYKGKGLTSTEVLTNFNLTKSRFGL